MKRLRQTTTGRIYAYTEALAKRPDMVLIEVEEEKPVKKKRARKPKTSKVKEVKTLSDLIDESDE